MDTDKMRVFTPAQLAECAKDALENWDWHAVSPSLDPKTIEDQKEALNFDEDYARDSFAEDDGLIHLDRAYSNVWDFLDEFAVSTAHNVAAMKEGW